MSIYWKKCRGCGRIFKTTKCRKLYCTEECRKIKQRASVRAYNKRLKELDTPPEREIKCKCPSCKEYHYLIKYYTGDLKVPYFICDNCKTGRLRNELRLSEEVIYNVDRWRVSHSVQERMIK